RLRARAWLAVLVEQARRGGVEQPALMAAGGDQALVLSGVISGSDAEAWMRELGLDGGSPPVRVEGGASGSGPGGSIPPPAFAAPQEFRGAELRGVVPVGRPVGPRAVVVCLELYDDGIVVVGFSSDLDPPFRDVAVGDRRRA